MQDKMKLRDFIEAKELKPEELDSIAGGVVWNDLTPEEQKHAATEIERAVKSAL